MYVLGINSAYHESSVCLIHNEVLLSAVEEERFSRVKHAKKSTVDNPDDLPLHAIYHCLNSTGISMSQIEYIGLSINPLKRLANKDFNDYFEAGNWGSLEGEERFFEQLSLIPDKLCALGFQGELIWVDHHMAHAASAFYPSPFSQAAVLAIDGIGETASTLLAFGDGHTLTPLKEISYPASLGFFWEKLSKFLGFSDYDACKVMGLASYGDPQPYAAAFRQLIWPLPDGGFAINNDILRFRIEDYAPLTEVLGVNKREPADPLTAAHTNIAAALQKANDEIVAHICAELYALTGSNNLCMAGGVALNCTTNRIAFEGSQFTNLYIQPVAHDAGTAIGAAYIIWNQILGKTERSAMSHPYVGPSFTDEQIETTLRANNLAFTYQPDIAKVVASLLSEQAIVGWFQGAMEIGPRALGNRSLLADPRDPGMQDLLNRRIKHRESFRPFAPSVLAEAAEEWFAIAKPTPVSDFMLLTYSVCAQQRDKVPAVVHVDQTSRVQTVRRSTNAKYYALIEEFYKLTGVPMLLNTSFNDNEPIVCTPQNAVDTFLKTKIDYLAIGNFLVFQCKGEPGSAG